MAQNKCKDHLENLLGEIEHLIKDMKKEPYIRKKELIISLKDIYLIHSERFSEIVS